MERRSKLHLEVIFETHVDQIKGNWLPCMHLYFFGA